MQNTTPSQRLWTVLYSLGLAAVAMLPFPAEAAAPTSDEAATEVNRRLLDDLGEPPTAGRTDDETFLRRVFLDIVGQTPTADDVLAFSLDSDPQKRTQIVDKLLGDPAYGENWGSYWRDVIMYRRTEPRAVLATESLTSYLSQELNRNTSWDQVASRFITATGEVRENGETGLIMAQGGKPEEVAAEVSRIFLGIQIQCAQCHDHPTDRWRREQFHELAAFFPRVAVRPTRDSNNRSFEVTVVDRQFGFRRPNNNNRYVGTPEHYMPDLEDPSAQGTQTQPVFFLTGEELSIGTRDADRRGSLAEWITADNPWFAKAFVNRMWSELVGEGFYEPVDDLGPDRSCSSPKTMEYLADAWRASGYDVKWLIRTIAATELYQATSRSRRDFDEQPFAANCAQRLRADQLYDALVSALNLQERVQPGRGGAGPRAGGPRALFNNVFGYDPSEPRETVSLSIPQALALMNAPFIDQAINAGRRDALGAILRDYPEDADAVTAVYLKTLSRAPSSSELQRCRSYIRSVGDRAEAFEDIQWALVNSTEFLHRN